VQTHRLVFDPVVEQQRRCCAPGWVCVCALVVVVVVVVVMVVLCRPAAAAVCAVCVPGFLSRTCACRRRGNWDCECFNGPVPLGYGRPFPRLPPTRLGGRAWWSGPALPCACPQAVFTLRVVVVVVCVSTL
jgi:hypothetical protein